MGIVCNTESSGKVEAGAVATQHADHKRMPSMPKPAGKRSIKSVLTVLAALITITCSEVRPAQTYVKDGVHLELPEGWEVFEDQISYSGRAT